jgi:hypothetical protein
MYIYSENKEFIIGCLENGIEILFNNPIPAWALIES